MGFHFFVFPSLSQWMKWKMISILYTACFIFVNLICTVLYLSHHTKQISFSLHFLNFSLPHKGKDLGEWEYGKLWHLPVFQLDHLQEVQLASQIAEKLRNKSQGGSKYLKIQSRRFLARRKMSWQNLSPLSLDDGTHPLATSTIVAGVQQTLHLIKKALSEEDSDMLDSPFRARSCRGTFWTTAMFCNANLWRCIKPFYMQWTSPLLNHFDFFLQEAAAASTVLPLGIAFPFVCNIIFGWYRRMMLNPFPCWWHLSVEQRNFQDFDEWKKCSRQHEWSWNNLSSCRLKQMGSQPVKKMFGWSDLGT